MSFSINSAHKLIRKFSRVGNKAESEVNILAINKMPGNDDQKVILFYTLPAEEHNGVAVIMKLDGNLSEKPNYFFWTQPAEQNQVRRIDYFHYDAR